MANNEGCGCSGCGCSGCFLVLAAIGFIAIVLLATGVIVFV